MRRVINKHIDDIKAFRTFDPTIFYKKAEKLAPDKDLKWLQSQAEQIRIAANTSSPRTDEIV